MINKLWINNFKCFVETQLDFNTITFLAGGNAVGKSSIIQSILLLKKAFENIEEEEVLINNVFTMNLGLPKDVISKDRSTEKISIKAANEFFSNEVIFEIGDEITNPLSLKIENCEEILVDLVNKESVFLKGFTYLNAERVGPRISLDMSSEKELNVGSQGEYTNHVMRKADLLMIEVCDELKSSSISRFSAHCEAWLNTIIPGTQLELDVIDNVNKATIRYKNLFTSSDYYVPTATGFGITYVLPIIVSALLSSVSKDSVLIIENPEAHLHPSGQSQIGKFLALVSSCGVQVIVETHSEHVINGARLQLAILNQTDKMLVHFFSNEDKSLKIEKISIQNNGELQRWPKGFFDQNKTDLRKLLELRLCKK